MQDHQERKEGAGKKKAKISFFFFAIFKAAVEDLLEMDVKAVAPLHIDFHGVCFQKEFVADKPKYTGNENSNANAVNKYHIQFVEGLALCHINIEKTTRTRLPFAIKIY